MKRAAVIWAARTTTAQRLATGSSSLLAWIGSRTAGWIRGGRRDDLTGVAAALGCIARALIVADGAYALWRIIRAAPVLLWALVPVWCWAALRAAPRTAAEPAPEEAPGEDDDAPAPDSRAMLIHWLDRLTRGRSGIHLSELHQHLTRDPGLTHLTQAGIRPWLEGHQITVARTLRVGSVAGRTGVSRSTIVDLLKTIPPVPESPGFSPTESGPDLQRSPHSPAPLHAWRGATRAPEERAS
ncbi:hypothetical protein ACIOG7_10455 [Streptomyces sp. NPDC087894]|uniref:hypothetical protein n=1 Tax=Streptomyces sp. NPDC087894 TaxID=3365816 RepID=UPI00382704E5